MRRILLRLLQLLLVLERTQPDLLWRRVLHDVHVDTYIERTVLCPLCRVRKVDGEV